ncbi:MAG: arsenosugar biosynthesis radical SAM (seleno)protein ArsS [Balneolaceae bacterium]
MSVKLKTLKKRRSHLSVADEQVKLLETHETPAPVFKQKLAEIGLNPFKPTEIEILQINVGYMCDLTCEHCHVDAGPERKEIMTRETMEMCLRAIDNSNVKTVDLTGGAPELNPDFKWFVSEITKRDVEVIVRSNLTILVSNQRFRTYPQFFREHGVQVIASLPCYTEENTDAQRGDGVFDKSIESLQILNSLGYGKKGSDLQLHLVYNPGGPSLPPLQKSLELDYKRILKERYNIEFHNLYTITNLPISRFLDLLLATGKYEEYMEKLAVAFNPAAADGVMCRNTVSVSWDGYLYDCDFNQMLQLRVEQNAPQHISEFDQKDLLEREIVTGQHCYGCTAGAGSSCQGALIN